MEGSDGKRRVRGPGQKCFIRVSYVREMAYPAGRIRSSISRDETWTMSGLSGGRPFVEKIFAAAAGSRASAPSPYTVSVGNATVLWARSSSDARRNASCVSGEVISGLSVRKDTESGSHSSISVVNAIAGRAFESYGAGSRRGAVLGRRLFNLFKTFMHQWSTAKSDRKIAMGLSQSSLGQFVRRCSWSKVYKSHLR